MKGGDEEAHCVPFSSHDRVFGHAPTRERGKRIYLCCACCASVPEVAIAVVCVAPFPRPLPDPLAFSPFSLL